MVIRTRFVQLAYLIILLWSAESYAADNPVLLEYDDIIIRKNDFDLMIETQVPPEARVNFLQDNKKVRQMIGDLFVIRKMAKEARAVKLHQRTDIEFKRSFQEDRLLMEEMLKYSLANAEHPDYEQLAKEEYLADNEKFRMPEEVRASHILIKITPERDESEAKKLAENLRKKILKNKDGFADLAAEYSEDPSAKHNLGDLGFFTQDKMVKPFADAAFAMKQEGDISDVIKTQFGYHIIQLSGRREARTLEFEQVKARLIAEQKQKFASEINRREVERVRSLEGINVDQIAVSKISGLEE